MNLSGPLDPNAQMGCLRFYGVLPTLKAGESILKAYLHWSVSDYVTTFPDYHACIVLEGTRFVIKLTNDPELNAVDSPLPAGHADHTYMRNSHAVGLAVAAMEGATTSDFGQYPVTQHQIEVLCAAAAAFALKYGIDAADDQAIMTHAEAALQTVSPPYTNYFCGAPNSDPDCRWDACRLEASPAPLSQQEAQTTGNLLRQRIHQYKLDLQAKVHV